MWHYYFTVSFKKENAMNNRCCCVATEKDLRQALA
jgi:hypothetical protein